MSYFFSWGTTTTAVPVVSPSLPIPTSVPEADDTSSTAGSEPEYLTLGSPGECLSDNYEMERNCDEDEEKTELIEPVSIPVRPFHKRPRLVDAYPCPLSPALERFASITRSPVLNAQNTTRVSFPVMVWRGIQYRHLIDEHKRRQVMRFFGAQHSARTVNEYIHELVSHKHAQVECSDSVSYTFSGSKDVSRQYGDLVISHLPVEWTEGIKKSLDRLFREVPGILSDADRISTEFQEVNVFQCVHNPDQLLLVHGNYSVERSCQNRVSELLFGKAEPTVTIHTHIRVITLMSSFLKVLYITTGASFRALMEDLLTI
jgi:hypothetical protein